MASASLIICDQQRLGQNGEVLKSFIQEAPPEVQILALFLCFLNNNKKNNRKGYLVKNEWMSFFFFYCPGWELAGIIPQRHFQAQELKYAKGVKLPFKLSLTYPFI